MSKWGVKRNDRQPGGDSMSKRVAIMISDENDKKLRLKQANLIRTTQTSVSYSRVLNETLEKKL